jgi:hypothetical protein
MKAMLAYVLTAQSMAPNREDATLPPAIRL